MNGGLSPVFICGIARSGATLLTTLLDGHPDLAVFPGEPRGYRGLMFGGPLGRLLLAVAESLEQERFLRGVVAGPWVGLAARGRRARARRLWEWSHVFGNGRLAPEEMIRRVVSSGWDRRCDPWPSFLDLYELLVPGGLDGRRYWVEKAPMNERFVPVAEVQFRGRALYLYTVRDPRAVLSSWFSARERLGILGDRREEALTVCYAWARSLHQGIEHARRHPDRYCLVRYEDLVRDLPGVMGVVARFLDVEVHPVLFRTTRLGRVVESNSSHTECRAARPGTVHGDQARSQETLTAEELRGVERLLRAQMVSVGYDPLTDESWVRRGRGSPFGARPELRALGQCRKIAAFQRGFQDVRPTFLRALWPSLVGGALAATSLTVGGCRDAASPEPVRPFVSVVAAEANPHNALSFIVRFEAAEADSVRAVAWSSDDEPRTTPFRPHAGGVGEAPILGLLPSTGYDFVVEAMGRGGASVTPVASFATPDLPDSLWDITLVGTGTVGPGFTLLSITRDSVPYVLAFGADGRLRWYRGFARGVRASETKQQPNGNVTVFLGNTSGWHDARGQFVEVAPDGRVVGSYAAPGSLYTDNHELLLTFETGTPPTAHFFSYDLRRADLSPIGGSQDVLLGGHQILRMSAAGEVRFLWNAWDHLALEDWVEPPDELKQRDNIDFDHPNSLHIDGDGHYVVSWRHLGEVTRIHSGTGEILWRLGGRNNQFTIQGDPLGGFSAQHSARILENGSLLLYDNGARHEPPESRAVEYALDLESLTATLAWEYRHEPPIYTPGLGSVQRLRSGNTLVGFGAEGVAVEVTPEGGVVWRAELMVEGERRGFYRVTRIASLYEHRAP